MINGLTQNRARRFLGAALITALAALALTGCVDTTSPSSGSGNKNLREGHDEKLFPNAAASGKVSAWVEVCHVKEDGDIIPVEESEKGFIFKDNGKVSLVVKTPYGWLEDTSMTWTTTANMLNLRSVKSGETVLIFSYTLSAGGVLTLRSPLDGLSAPPPGIELENRMIGYQRVEITIGVNIPFMAGEEEAWINCDGSGTCIGFFFQFDFDAAMDGKPGGKLVELNSDDDGATWTRDTVGEWTADGDTVKIIFDDGRPDEKFDHTKVENDGLKIGDLTFDKQPTTPGQGGSGSIILGSDEIWSESCNSDGLCEGMIFKRNNEFARVRSNDNGVTWYVWITGTWTQRGNSITVIYITGETETFTYVITIGSGTGGNTLTITIGNRTIIYIIVINVKIPGVTSGQNDFELIIRTDEAWANCEDGVCRGVVYGEKYEYIIIISYDNGATWESEVVGTWRRGPGNTIIIIYFDGRTETLDWTLTGGGSLTTICKITNTTVIYIKRSSGGGIPGGSTRSITIDMFSENGRGWGNGALEIRVNGIPRDTVRLNSGSYGTHVFIVNISDVVEFYWISGGANDANNAFSAHYTDSPPPQRYDPTINVNVTVHIRILIHYRYYYLNTIPSGRRLGGITVSSSDGSSGSGSGLVLEPGEAWMTCDMRPGFCDGFAFQPNGDLVQIASNNNGITWMGQVVGTWFVNRNLLTLNVPGQQAMIGVYNMSPTTVEFDGHTFTKISGIEIIFIGGGGGEDGPGNGGGDGPGVGGTFTDSRDGKTYRTVKIGDLTWMAENLNYATSDGSSCYSDNPSNCAKYGRLYNWDAAMSACPAGWHLPAQDEWRDLVRIADGIIGPAVKLKSKTGWHNKDGVSHGNGTDEFGFSALPGGGRWLDFDFFTTGTSGYWWSATDHPNNSESAIFVSMYEHSDITGAGGSGYDKRYAFSVRCILDERP